MNEQVFILWRCDDGSIERKKGLRMLQFFGQLWWLKAQVVLVEHSITVLIPKGVGLFLSYDGMIIECSLEVSQQENQVMSCGPL